MKITLRSWDLVIEGFCLLALAGGILLTAWALPQLSELIPTRLNGRGEISSYGNKYQLWILNLLPLLFYVLITSLSFRSWFFKAAGIHPGFFPLIYRVLSVLKLALVLLFVWFLYERIGLALGLQRPDAPEYLLPAFFALSYGTIIYSLTRLSRARNLNNSN